MGWVGSHKMDPWTTLGYDSRSCVWASGFKNVIEFYVLNADSGRCADALVSYTHFCRISA